MEIGFNITNDGRRFHDAFEEKPMSLKKWKSKNYLYTRLCNRTTMCVYCRPQEFPGDDYGCLDGLCEYKKTLHQARKRKIKAALEFPEISKLKQCPILAEGKTLRDIPRYEIFQRKEEL